MDPNKHNYMLSQQGSALANQVLNHILRKKSHSLMFLKIGLGVTILQISGGRLAEERITKLDTVTHLMPLVSVDLGIHRWRRPNFAKDPADQLPMSQR